MRKMLVCGGREFSDKDFLAKTLDSVLAKCGGVHYVVTGGARGADSLAYEWAKRGGIQTVLCEANWDKFGKWAGYRRNAAMLGLLSDGDIVVGFPGGKGTQMMLDLARKRGNLVVITTDPTAT